MRGYFGFAVQPYEKSIYSNTLHLIICILMLIKYIGFGLNTLSALRLDHNNITTIPDCIAEMKGLKRIFLLDNDITTLPEAMVQMEQLEELYLYQNKLTDLPEWIRKLKNLKELSIGGNLISDENKAKIQSWFAGPNVLIFID